MYFNHFHALYRIIPGKAGNIMRTCHYNVNGLLNSQMKTQVKNVLGELEGVKKVNVDLHRGTVEVHYNNATSENDIRNQIEHVGCKIE